MNPDRWERLKGIFTEALAVSADHQDEFLLNVCDGDLELLTDARRLIADYKRGLDFPSIALSLSHSVDSGPLFHPGQILADRFQIVRLLSRGGMGEVYEAVDQMLEQRVALKTIQPGLINESTIGLLKHELQSARRVSHPNVCRTYDIAEHGDPRVTLFTMELLEGQTLSSYVREHGPFSRREALPLIEQIANGLQAAHNAGVIHSDFKAGNVILSGNRRELRPVITDFGLALTPRSMKQTSELRGGTPGYMAPEQLEGGELSCATDVYGFGVVIALMLGARSANAGWSPVSPPDPLSPVDDWKRTGPWRKVIERCLATDPSQRYQRPEQVARALRRIAIRQSILPIAVTAAAIIAASIFFWRDNERGPAGFTVRKIADETGQDNFTSISPDGRFIAGRFQEEANLGVWDVRSGALRLLTSTRERGGGASVPLVSPDASRIAYTWLTRQGIELRLAETATGDNRAILRDASVTNATPVAWHSDGVRLAVHAEWTDGRRGLGILSTDTGLVLPITTSSHAQAAARVVYSPRTDELIFDAPQRGDQYLHDIFAVRLDGTLERRLIESPSHDYVADVTRSGDQLVFVSDFNGSPSIWTLALENAPTPKLREPRLLVPSLGDITPVGLAANGDLYYRVQADYRLVYTAELDFKSRKAIGTPRPVGRGRFPSWSRDGSTLSFIVDTNRLHFWTGATESVREITVPLRGLRRAQWRGDRLVAWGFGENIEGFVEVDPITGNFSPLMTRQQAGTASEGVWSADGKIWYSRFQDARRGLFRYDFETKSREVVFVPSEDQEMGLENLSLSPNEQALAFQVRKAPSIEGGTLFLLPLAGGAPRPLFTASRPEFFMFGAFTWLSDSSALLVARSRIDNDTSQLWLVPVDGSSPERVEFPAMAVRALRLSPNNRTIAFHSGDTERWELRVLENFLP